MKLISLSLILVLFTAPLYAGNERPSGTNPRPRSSSSDINIGMLLAVGVVFAGIYIYEWYTEPKTNAPVQSIKTNTQKMPIDVKNITEKISSVRSPELVIEKIPSEPITAIIPKQEIPIPTEPTLPPQPPLRQLPFPEEKPIMTAASTKTVPSSKTISKQDPHKKHASAYDLNDPFNGTK